jgi:hypothetical protein
MGIGSASTKIKPSQILFASRRFTEASELENNLIESNGDLPPTATTIKAFADTIAALEANGSEARGRRVDRGQSLEDYNTRANVKARLSVYRAMKIHLESGKSLSEYDVGSGVSGTPSQSGGRENLEYVREEEYDGGVDPYENIPLE